MTDEYLIDNVLFMRRKAISSDEISLNRSLLRALSLLGLFTPERPELTLTEISKLSGLAPATTYRLLATLCHAGFLEKRVSTGQYRIGLQAYVVGLLYLNVHDVLQHVDPVLNLVNELTGERVGLSVLDTTHAHTLLLRERNARHPIRFIEPPGVNFLAHATANGKVLLSELSMTELLAIYPNEKLEQHTSATIGTREQLLKELERVRDSGVAHNDGESVTGVWAVAGPVRNSEGRVVASLHVAAPALRLDAATRIRLTGVVKRAAALAGARLGWRVGNGTIPNDDDLRSWWRTQSDSDK